MKHLLYLFALVLLSNSAFTQTETEKEERIFDFAEVAPEYPGGVNELRRYIAKNYTLPDNFQGKETLVVRFVVLETGEVGEIQLIKKSPTCDVCNQKAIELFKNLPEKFSPGMQAGKPVKVRYTQAIVLSQGKAKKKKKNKRK